VCGLAEVGGADEILLYLDRPLPPDAPPLAFEGIVDGLGEGGESAER
jgi:hypothetical protein